MTKTYRSLWLLGILCVGLLGSVATSPVLAAEKSANGIRVTPGIAAITLEAGKTQTDTDITVTNNFQSRVTFEAQLRSVDEDNGVLVPSDIPKNSLESNVSITPKTFTLEPQASIVVRVTAHDAPGLSPGGNYASLLIRQASDVTSNLGLHAAVSVGLFITKEQGAIRKLTVSKPLLPTIAFWMPNAVDLTFRNTGNVLLVPRGSLLISRGDTVLTKAVVNENSLSVLPNNKLVLQNQLTQLQDAWLPGRYTTSLQYRYDGDLTNGTVSKYSFFYLPLQSLLLVAIMLIMVAYLLPHGHKAYRRVRKRRVIP